MVISKLHPIIFELCFKLTTPTTIQWLIFIITEDFGSKDSNVQLKRTLKAAR